MQMSKNQDNPAFPLFYLKRLSILLAIGLIHAFFWSGDILTLYALMGMVLLGLRKINVSRFLIYSVCFYFFPILLDIIYMYTFAMDLPIHEKIALKVYPDMSPEEVVAGFQSGQFFTTIRTNLHNLIWRWYDFIPTGRPFKILGLFLLGSYLYYKNFFTVGALKWKNLILFLLFGLAFTSLSMLLPGSIASFSHSWSDIVYRLIHEIGQISLSISYVCILAKLVNRFPMFFVFHWLKNYGRMSLTSYLGHTFFGILVFYPFFAWGYFGRLTFQTTFIIAFIILATQLLFSNIWLKFFRFGPIEWLWRCATYGKWFKLKNNNE